MEDDNNNNCKDGKGDGATDNNGCLDAWMIGDWSIVCPTNQPYGIVKGFASASNPQSTTS